MALILDDITSLYDTFITKGMEELRLLQESTQMEDEFLSTASSQIIVGAMGNSIQALESLQRVASMVIEDTIKQAQNTKDLLVKEAQIQESAKNLLVKQSQIESEEQRVASMVIEDTIKQAQNTKDLLVKDAQIASEAKNLLVKQSQIESEEQRVASMVIEDTIKQAQNTKDLLVKDAQKTILDKQAVTEDKKSIDLVSGTTVRNAQHAKDMLIKDQQEIAERIKNGGLYYAYTYDDNGNVLTKALQAGTTKSVYEYQSDKLLADTLFVKQQMLQLGYSVTYNNRLKVAENYGDMLGNLGLGGLNVSSGMWTTYFNMLNDVYTNYGDAPVTKTISVPAAAALVLTKIV
jgi:predicted phosphatase